MRVLFAGTLMVALGAVLMTSTAAWAADSLPSYMHVAAGSGQPPPKAQIARDNVNALDDRMQAVYAKSLEIYKANIRAQYPVIIARFDDWGGSMTLYPPGKDPA